MSKYKKIDGRTYKLYETYKFKDQAKRAAQRARKQGKRARVIRGDRRWELWVTGWQSLTGVW